MKTCPDCNGDGVIEKGTDDEQRCPTCGGLGFVADDNGGKEEEEVIKTLRARTPMPSQRGASHNIDKRVSREIAQKQANLVIELVNSVYSGSFCWHDRMDPAIQQLVSQDGDDQAGKQRNQELAHPPKSKTDVSPKD